MRTPATTDAPRRSMVRTALSRGFTTHRACATCPSTAPALNVQLSAQELHGLARFNDPTKGNCAACHVSAGLADGTPPLFTDFTYDNLGVPCNPDIPANADPFNFDLGLCGPDRTDLTSRDELCGAFRVPGLRNVAVTASYFHNGRFATLREVVLFGVRRDTNPEEGYPNAGAESLDDLPAQFHANVNTSEPPYDRNLGDLPALAPTRSMLWSRFSKP